jgi:hypothetical protein
MNRPYPWYCPRCRKATVRPNINRIPQCNYCGELVHDVEDCHQAIETVRERPTETDTKPLVS